MIVSNFAQIGSRWRTSQKDEQSGRFLCEERKVLGTGNLGNQDDFCVTGNALLCRQHLLGECRIIDRYRVWFLDFNVGGSA